MTDIDVMQYTTSNEAGKAAEAAFIAAHPEPVKPEKTYVFSRPLLIEAQDARLWVELREVGWSTPTEANLYLRSHGSIEEVKMEPEELKALLEQIALKMGELEVAQAYYAAYQIYKDAQREWSNQKESAIYAARTAWSQAQKTLRKAPDPSDYTHDDIEMSEGFDEDDIDDDSEEDEDEDL